MKKYLCMFMLCLPMFSQAQEMDIPWRLRIMDLKHQVRSEATVRFRKAADTESCMGGDWKRVDVEAEKGTDMEFFPLAAPMSYRQQHGNLVFGRTGVCDGYQFMSGKPAKEKMHGEYYALGFRYHTRLGYFTLERLR